MMEKALVIMVFLWASAFGLLGAQYVFADVFGIIMVSPVTGTPMKSALLTYFNINTINQIGTNVTGTQRSQVTTNINEFLSIVWEMIQILTGTYVFNVFNLLGIPVITTTGFIALYVFLLVRAYFGYIRGITKDKLYARLFQHNAYDKISLCVGHSMKNIFGISFIKYRRYESYKVNDVITFIGLNNVKYCHRIIKIDKQYFTAKGDNILEPEQYETNVPLLNIEGKVFWSNPKWDFI